MEIENINKIYFVGIGGIAMSAAAGLAREAGFDVRGSDSKEVYSPARDVLDRFKIPYSVGYEASNVERNKADLYVLSAGEDTNNPEVRYIVDHNLPRVSFSELLYELSKNEIRIVVAGTNGKSTTTGLVGHLLKALDNSSFMAGAVLQNYESNFYRGDGHYFVFEGDEYKSQFDDPAPKFHYYKPDILVLTNLELDHPDIYDSLESLKEEFRELIATMPPDGLIIYNADDENLAKLVYESEIHSASFGVHNPADYKVEHIEYLPELTEFSLTNKFSRDIVDLAIGATEDYKTQLPGEINVYNAVAAVALLRALGFKYEQLALDMMSYKGVKRRFELVGKKRGITLIDDYGHHPTAVRETLKAARTRYPDARIWAVFEPHTFSRTQATLPDLVKSFGDADEVLISEIYPAREKASEATITSQEVVDAVASEILNSAPPKADGPAPHSSPSDHLPSESRTGGLKSDTAVRLVHTKQEALDILKAETKPGDVVIVMAVGSFNRLAYELKEVL